MKGVRLDRDPEVAVVGCIALATCLVLFSFAAGCSDRRDEGEVSFEGLLHQMTNVQALAQRPLGTSAMASSYDRNGGNCDWGDFSDSPKGAWRDIVRLKGPGVVHRIWLTGQAPSEWRLFVDESPSPLVVGIDPVAPATNTIGYAFSLLQSRGSGGYTSYVPIPFAKSLRVAVPAEYRAARPYYQINYEILPARIPVSSVRPELSSEQKLLVDSVAATLGDLDRVHADAADRCETEGGYDLAPGETWEWLQEAGRGQLDTFWLSLAFKDACSQDQRAGMLRSLVLRLYWDGAAEPSVNVPLGDFFCNAFHSRRFSSLALARIGDRYVCRFPMPFGSGVRGEVVNEGMAHVSVKAGYSLASQVPARAGGARFHCEWSQTEAFQKAPGVPHRVLETKGKGHLVACYLTALAGDPNWFILEGDDIIYRDGEKMPSFHGTGLEDYFNGAWYYFGLSDLAYDGLLEKAGPRTSQYRYHFPDKLEFSRELEFDFEFGHVMAATTPANTSRGYMSSAAFWYQSPARCARPLPPVRERVERIDPLKEWTLMAEIIELEIADRSVEARERCSEYAVRYHGRPTGVTMALRAAAYDGLTSKAMSSQLSAAVSDASESVRASARVLGTFASKTNAALVHVDTSAAFQCWLDGKPLISGNDPRLLHTAFMDLQPGGHELTLELRSQGIGSRPWLAASVQTHGTNLHFTTGWDVSTVAPKGWPSDVAGIIDHRWKQRVTPPTRHPCLANWAMVPNFFPHIQAQELHRLDRGMFGGRPVYYRKHFRLSSPNQERPTDGPESLSGSGCEAETVP